MNQLLKLFAYLHSFYGDLCDRQEGQTMAEYGVILAVITPAIVAVLALLSMTIGNRFLGVLEFFS